MKLWNIWLKIRDGSKIIYNKNDVKMKMWWLWIHGIDQMCVEHVCMVAYIFEIFESWYCY